MIGIYSRISAHLTKMLEDEARDLHPPSEIAGIAFHVPPHYLRPIGEVLDLLKAADGAAFDQVTTRLRAVYAAPEPVGVGSIAGIAFIHSTYTAEDLSAGPWVSLAGYLVFMANVSDSIASGHASAMIKGTRWRKMADEAEKRVVERLEEILKGSAAS